MNNIIVLLISLAASSLAFSKSQTDTQATNPIEEKDSANNLQSRTNITLADGSLIKNAIIRRVEPDGILVMTDDFLKKYQFDQISQDLQKKYNYDPISASEYKQKSIQAQQKAAYINQNSDKGEFLVIQSLKKGALATYIGKNEEDRNPFSKNLFYVDGLINVTDGSLVKILCYIDGNYSYETVGGLNKTIPRISVIKRCE